MGTPDERGAAPRNTARLTGEVARRRQAAVAGHQGAPDVARLLLADPDPGVRLIALGALDRLADLSAAELEHGLADPAATVRRRSCEIAAGWPGALPVAAGDRPGDDDGPSDDPAAVRDAETDAETDAVPDCGPNTGSGPSTTGHIVSLLGVLDDPDPVVVEVAAWASGERVPPEPGAVARLIELVTGHDDALCREAAVAALGAIGDDVALPAILAATHDKATVRRRAVIALAPFDGPDVDTALETARTDRDWQVRQAAEDLLADG